MLIELYREKLVHSIIYFVKNTKYCGKTKLFKLLFYLDFSHFKQSGKSVTNLDYFAWDYGPVPQELFQELGNPPADLRKFLAFSNDPDNPLFQIKAKKRFEKKYFTKREIRILEKLAYIFKEAKAEDMVEATHLPNEPWDKTIKSKGQKAKIDYLLALDTTSDSLSPEEALERIEDRKKIKKVLA